MEINLRTSISVLISILLFVVSYIYFNLLGSQEYPDILRPFATFIFIASIILAILFIISAIAEYSNHQTKVSDYDDERKHISLNLFTIATFPPSL